MLSQKFSKSPNSVGLKKSSVYTCLGVQHSNFSVSSLVKQGSALTQRRATN